MGLAPPSKRRMNHENDLDDFTWHRCADGHSRGTAFADPGYTGKSGVEFYGGKPVALLPVRPLLIPATAARASLPVRPRPCPPHPAIGR